MTTAQQQDATATGALAGLTLLTPQQYTVAQASINRRVLELALRTMRKYGVPLTGPAQQQMAMRLFPEVQAARMLSYQLAVRSMEYSAHAADEALPTIARIAPYAPDALMKVLQNAVAPLQPMSPAARPAQLTILDRRTGMPFPTRDQDLSPSSPQVMVTVGENAGAAAARHANQAGRDAIHRTADMAGEEVAWARVTTSAHPCAFCVMLASRDPFRQGYRSDKTALFRSDGEKYHYRCKCRVVLVYRHKPWDGEAAYRQAEDLWKTATSGFKGVDALNALRRTLYAQRANAAAAS